RIPCCLATGSFTAPAGWSGSSFKDRTLRGRTVPVDGTASCWRSKLAAQVRLSVVTTSLPAAVLWDMDGTLIDSEPYWISAETALVESFGGTWTHEEALVLVGQGLDYSARMLQAKGVELSEEEIILGLTQRVLEQVR